MLQKLIDDSELSPSTKMTTGNQNAEKLQTPIILKVNIFIFYFLKVEEEEIRVTII